MRLTNLDATPTALPVGAGMMWGIWLARVCVGFLWMSGSSWKVPPDFGESAGKGLFRWASYAVEYPVFAPYSWLVEKLILPNIQLFGWLTLLTEASLGAFLLVGLFTRFWAIVGIVQTLAIIGSAFNAPHEWPWSFYLMLVTHVVLLTTAAGRAHGLDGLLRRRWLASETLLAKLMVRAS